MMPSDFTREEENIFYSAMFTWYGLPQQYIVGKDVRLNGESMKQITIKEWMPKYLPLAMKPTTQELDYPNFVLGFGGIIDSMKFGETISWMIFGVYSRLDNHNDTVFSMQIDTGVDWMRVEVKPQTIPNNTGFKVLFVLTKTKSLMKMIKKEKTFHWLPKISGQMGRY